MVVWASPGPDGYGLYSRPIGGAVGEALSDPSPSRPTLQSFDTSLVQLIVRSSTGSGARVLGLSQDVSGAMIQLLELDASGQLQAPARTVATTPAPIVWADVDDPDGDGRPVVVWAERHEHSADLYTAIAGPSGSGMVRQIERGAIAWQFLDVGGKSALATVVGTPGTSHPYRLRVNLIDAGGQVDAEPIEVADLDRGGLDLDMAMSGEDLILSWSETDGFESRLRLARVDLTKRTAEAGYATQPRGDQVLLRLVGHGGRVSAIWEEPQRSSPHRDVWIGDVVTSGSTAGEVEPLGRLQLAKQDHILPIFAPDGDQLAVVAQGQACITADGFPCVSDQIDRFFVRMRQEDAPTAIPLSPLLAPAHAALVWDLRCRVGTKAQRSCVALASDGAAPSQVYLLDLDATDAPRTLAPYFDVRGGVGHIESRREIADVPELSHLRAMSSESGVLLAWLSYFDPNEPYLQPDRPAPDGRRAPVRALLSTEWLPHGSVQRGGAPRASHSVSLRARSWGGLGLAAGVDQALLVWAALDAGDPQVFATLLEPTGKRIRQQMVTRTSGEVFDLNVVPTNDGYVIVWIDGMSGSDQVWAMRIDRSLRTSSPVQISEGAGAPMGLSAKREGEQIIVAWADARDDHSRKTSLIYLASISTDGATIISPEVSLSCDGLSCHSPQLGIARGETSRLVLSYLERAHSGEQDSASSSDLEFARLRYISRQFQTRIDLPSLASSPPQAVPGSAVGTYFLDCAEQCRAALLKRHDERLELWLAVLGSREAKTSFAMTLDGHFPEATVPALVGEHLYYSEPSPSSDSHRLMQATIRWH